MGQRTQKNKANKVNNQNNKLTNINNVFKRKRKDTVLMKKEQDVIFIFLLEEHSETNKSATI